MKLCVKIMFIKCIIWIRWMINLSEEEVVQAKDPTKDNVDEFVAAWSSVDWHQVLHQSCSNV